MLDTTGNSTEVLEIIWGLLRMASEATVSSSLLASPLLHPALRTSVSCNWATCNPVECAAIVQGLGVAESMRKQAGEGT